MPYAWAVGWFASVVVEDTFWSCDVSGAATLLEALVAPIELAVDLAGDSSG